MKHSTTPHTEGNALRSEYFPSRILPDSLTLNEAELAQRYPVREELWRRAQHGFSLVNPHMRHVTASDLEVLNNLELYLGAHADGSCVTLRQGQVPVFKSLVTFFERGLRSGFVVVPTRGGKTVIFVELAETVGKKTLILVPTKELIKQTFDRVTTFAPDLDVGIHSGRLKEGLDHQVVISTYSYWMSAVKRGGIKPGDFPLLILDEAHEILSTKKRILIEPFLESDTVIGFTATDKYSDKKCLLRVLKNAIHRMSITEAINLGLITPYTIMTAETRIDLSSVRTDFSKGDFNQGDLESALNRPELTADSIYLYQTHFEGQSGIISCCGVDHARAVAKGFNDAGISAAAIWGDMNNTARKNAIDAHLAGEIKVLTNAKLLLTGYDNERVSFIFNLMPTMSLKHATQRGGRPLTINSEDPEKVATIVEFLHHDPGKRRRQMTFLDATHHISYGKVTPKQKTIPERTRAKKNSLVITADPELAKQVIDTHSEDSQPIKRKVAHESDSVNLAIKALQLDRVRLYLSVGYTTMLLKRESVNRTSAAKKQIAQLFNQAAKEVKKRYESISKEPLSALRTDQLGQDNREILLHIERKFRGTAVSPAQLVVLRNLYRQERDKLKTLFSEIASGVSLPDDVTVLELFRHVDARCTDGKLSVETLAKISERAGANWHEKIALALKKIIIPIEDTILTRWDAFSTIMDQVEAIESELRNLERPLLRATKKIIDEEIQIYQGRSYSLNELKQEAWSLALPHLDHFLFEGERSRFSTYIGRKLKIELRDSMNAVDHAALNLYYTEDHEIAREGEEYNSVRENSYHTELLLRFPSPITFLGELEMVEKETVVGPLSDLSEDDYSLLNAGELIASEQHYLRGSECRPPSQISLEIGELLNSSLAMLTYREREILKVRYFDNATLEEAAAMFQVTRERIRQIEAKAIRKLQSALASTQP
jgi:RNA polymerase sigma factor (sigma-70 family)